MLWLLHGRRHAQIRRRARTKGPTPQGGPAGAERALLGLLGEETRHACSRGCAVHAQ